MEAADVCVCACVVCVFVCFVMCLCVCVRVCGKDDVETWFAPGHYEPLLRPFNEYGVNIIRKTHKDKTQ